MTRSEYPRPQLVREDWTNLNGEWQFDFDDENIGVKEGWYDKTTSLSQTIQVPFAFQTELSGINDQGPHEIVWYKRSFSLGESLEGQRLIIHFGAVDFESKVFVNGKYVGEHIGGSTPFSFDITELVDENLDEQIVTVRAFDPRHDQTIPRGKQTWEAEPQSIWYTNTSGIWQTVWLERVSETYVKNIYYDTDIDKGVVRLRVHLSEHQDDLALAYKISSKDGLVASGKIDVFSAYSEINVELFQRDVNRTAFHHGGYLWSPENPHLFDVELSLVKEDKTLDEVSSYFGMRKVHTENGMLYLNNRPYYLRMALDQGYWPESLMTAPSDEALKRDVELAKELGFNGVRKHQKVEDPLFLHWADRLGLIVWGESGSAQFFSERSVDLLSQEWKEIVDRDYNHPSIIVWVPFNESWGINEVGRNRQQQHYTQALYHLIHSLDTTRLVISNDGWEITETDIVAVHNYQHGQVDETRKFAKYQEDILEVDGILESMSAARTVFAEGFDYTGQPIMLTEYGGIAYKTGAQEGWGYTSVENADDFVSEYRRIAEVLLNSKALAGYCYTQLYDVEKEINGLLTYDRQPKCDVKLIREINEQFTHHRIKLT